jgi:hypothetical protein
MSKEKFDFYIDKKITMWVREHHTIECETLDEAKTKMIESFKNDDFDDTYEDSETLYGTETDMEPGDNDGQSTAELFYSDTDELLTTNIQ